MAFQWGAALVQGLGPGHCSFQPCPPASWEQKQVPARRTEMGSALDVLTLGLQVSLVVKSPLTMRTWHWVSIPGPEGP